MMQIHTWAARNQKEGFFKKIQSFFADRLPLYRTEQAERKQSARVQLCPDLLTDELHDMCNVIVAFRKATRHWEGLDCTLHLVVAVAFELQEENTFRTAAMYSKDEYALAHYTCSGEFPQATPMAFARALRLEPTPGLWRDINWWISLHNDLQERSNVCDAIITSYKDMKKRHVG